MIIGWWGWSVFWYWLSWVFVVCYCLCWGCRFCFSCRKCRFGSCVVSYSLLFGYSVVWVLGWSYGYWWCCLGWSCDWFCCCWCWSVCLVVMGWSCIVIVICYILIRVCWVFVDVWCCCWDRWNVCWLFCGNDVYCFFWLCFICLGWCCCVFLLGWCLFSGWFSYRLGVVGIFVYGYDWGLRCCWWSCVGGFWYFFIVMLGCCLGFVSVSGWRDGCRKCCFWCFCWCCWRGILSLECLGWFLNRNLWFVGYCWWICYLVVMYCVIGCSGWYCWMVRLCWVCWFVCRSLGGRIWWCWRLGWLGWCSVSCGCWGWWSFCIVVVVRLCWGLMSLVFDLGWVCFVCWFLVGCWLVVGCVLGYWYLVDVFWLVVWVVFLFVFVVYWWFFWFVCVWGNFWLFVGVFCCFRCFVLVLLFGLIGSCFGGIWWWGGWLGWLVWLGIFVCWVYVGNRIWVLFCYSGCCF